MAVVTSTYFPDGDVNIIAPMANLGAQTTEAERRALGLKIFAGEVLNAYFDNTLMEGKTRSITIESGISAQFPHTGSVQGGFHKPGTALAINLTQQAERVITVDDIVYAAVFFPLMYDLISHIDVRQEYARAAGYILGGSVDTMMMCEVIKAARSAALIPGVTDGGAQIVSDSFKIDPAGAANEGELAMAVFQGLFAAADVFDQKRIPGNEPRFAAFRPYIYNLLVRAIMTGGFALSNVDYMAQRANINQNILPPIAGFTILKHNDVPSTNLTATGDAHSGTPNTLAARPIHTNHAVDASKTIGIIWTPAAVGKVQRQGLATKMSEEVTHLGNLNVSYMLAGAGVLRPESAIEFTLSALSN